MKVLKVFLDKRIKSVKDMKQYNILGGIDNLTQKQKKMNYKELENEVIKWADNKGILTNGITLKPIYGSYENYAITSKQCQIIKQ